MRRKSPTTRRQIIEAAYSLFYEKGFSRVSVDDVAARAGVTKRTLYAHFASKDGLLTAALDFHNELALARIRVWADKLTGSAEAMVEKLFADFARWAAKPRWTGTGFTRLAMELADMPGHPAHAVASRHKATVENWLAGELARRKVSRARERAREVVLILEGTNALMLIHRDAAYAKAAARAAKRLLKER